MTSYNMKLNIMDNPMILKVSLDYVIFGPMLDFFMKSMMPTLKKLDLVD